MVDDAAHARFAKRTRLILRHKILHHHLDELFACFIAAHPERTGFLDTPLKEFIDWSHAMTLDPTCAERPHEVTVL